MCACAVQSHVTATPSSISLFSPPPPPSPSFRPPANVCGWRHGGLCPTRAVRLPSYRCALFFLTRSGRLDGCTSARVRAAQHGHGQAARSLNHKHMHEDALYPNPTRSCSLLSLSVCLSVSATNTPSDRLSRPHGQTATRLHTRASPKCRASMPVAQPSPAQAPPQGPAM